MIIGFFRGGSPRIVARIRLDALSDRSRDVEFVVDTGAAVSVVQLGVVADLGVAPDDLRWLPTERNETLGGIVIHALTDATLTFARDDETSFERKLSMRVSLAPPVTVDDAPSVLGMNALRVFRVIVSVPESRVALEFP